MSAAAPQTLLSPPLPLSSHPILPSPILKSLPYLNSPLTPHSGASLPQKHRLNHHLPRRKEITCNGNVHTHHLPVQLPIRIFLMELGRICELLFEIWSLVEGYFYGLQPNKLV